MSYQYSKEAKERISALGQTAVTKFIEEIPLYLRRAVYSKLPRVQGFRQGSQAEVKEKQKRLIGRMFRPQTSLEDEGAWKSFALFWGAWAEDRFGKALPNYDISSPSFVSSPIFIRELADSFPGVAREDVERLLTFSSFPDHPDTAVALAHFRLASDLMRDKIVDELPALLKGIRSRLEVIEAAIAGADERIGRLQSISTSLIEDVDKVSNDITWNTAAVNELRTLLDVETKHSGMVETVVYELGAASQKNNEVLTKVNFQLDVLAQSLQEFSLRGDRWDGVVNEFVELKSTISALSEHEAKRVGVIESIATLTERATFLEGRLVENNAGSGIKQRVRLLENNPEGPFIDILSIDSACKILESNLQAVGVAKGASIFVARHIVAAFIAGQIIQFSGSLADIVADAVAAAIGGPTYHEWRVPVGLFSDEAASECIETIAESSGCLLLKGANLSAFEVYGTAVRDIVVRRQFSVSGYDHLALITTWTQGPAAFPDGGMLAELGPVFDTDTLQMRGISAKLPQLKFGRLTKETWGRLEGQETDCPKPDMEEFRELIDEAGFEGGNLWRRMVNRIYAILMGMPNGNLAGDLHSLLISWAVPWAKALGGPDKEIARIAEREFSERPDETTA
ncbi:hypothetical protein [Sodalis sp. RH20]|uniref:hypothetical protein n=1 Tax=unclassified Sodalis (in: enterobacteria) TaxID=2636512 RepID=UPI0039B52CD2